MKPKAKPKRRPNLPRITEETKQWSAMLGTELQTWPNVTTRPMFGLLSFYRKRAIFAALPVTRAMGAPNSIIFKIKCITPDLLLRVNQDRRASIGTRMRAKGWISFEMDGSDDLRDALSWLSEAYQRAK